MGEVGGWLFKKINNIKLAWDLVLPIHKRLPKFLMNFQGSSSTGPQTNCLQPSCIGMDWKGQNGPGKNPAPTKDGGRRRSQPDLEICWGQDTS